MTEKRRASTTVGFIFATVDQSWLGGKNYYRSLFNALQLAGVRDLTVKVFCGGSSETLKNDFPRSVVIVETRLLKKFSLPWWLDKLFQRALGHRLLLRTLMNRHGVNVFSHTDPELTGSTPCISWIPDFQHLYLPQFFSGEEIDSRNQQYKRLIVDSQLVIVSSYSAKKDLDRFLPKMDQKVRVLRFCANYPTQLPTAQACLDVLDNYGLTAGTFFYVPNQLWAHKNHALLLQALAELKATGRSAKVVCTGSLTDPRNPDHHEWIKSKAHELDLQENFLLLGLVPYAHIAKLMIASAAVINPSFFEGWSTTVEEAKALGVPLLLSNIPVHIEQCAAAEACFFNPTEPQELSNQMLEHLSNKPSLDDKVQSAQSALTRYQKKIAEFGLEYKAIVDEALR